MKEYKQKILDVLKKYHVKRAGLFGSYAKETQTEFSDIDILVELDNELSLLEFINIKLELEETLNKKVDLVEYNYIKPLIRDSVLNDEVRIL